MAGAPRRRRPRSARRGDRPRAVRVRRCSVRGDRQPRARWRRSVGRAIGRAPAGRDPGVIRDRAGRGPRDSGERAPPRRRRRAVLRGLAGGRRRLFVAGALDGWGAPRGAGGRVRSGSGHVGARARPPRARRDQKLRHRGRAVAAPYGARHVVGGVVERYGCAPMTVVRASIDVDAPPERVWKVVSDPRNLPLWDRHIESVEGVPPEGVREGSRYTTVLRLISVHAQVPAEVLELDPPRMGRVRLGGLIDAIVTTRIDPLAGNRSRLEHQVNYRFRGGPLGKLAARSLRMIGGAGLALRHGALAQKRQIEDGAR